MYVCIGVCVFVLTIAFLWPQGEQGEAGNPGPTGESGIGVSPPLSFELCESIYATCTSTCTCTLLKHLFISRVESSGSNVCECGHYEMSHRIHPEGGTQQHLMWVFVAIDATLCIHPSEANSGLSMGPSPAVYLLFSTPLPRACVSPDAPHVAIKRLVPLNHHCCRCLRAVKRLGR